jgi:hypothetical protein
MAEWVTKLVDESSVLSCEGALEFAFHDCLTLT